MLKEMIIMSPERRVVKEWLRTVDHEELDAMLQAAIFTPDEQRYIHIGGGRNVWIPRLPNWNVRRDTANAG